MQCSIQVFKCQDITVPAVALIPREIVEIVNLKKVLTIMQSCAFALENGLDQACLI